MSLIKAVFWKWIAFEESVGHLHHLGWRVWNKIFGLDPSDCVLLSTVTATVTSVMTALQKKSFIVQKQTEMMIWDYRNGWCCWGNLNSFDTAFMMFVSSRLGTRDKVILILPFVSNPIRELMFSSSPAAFNCFPLLLLNSAIVLLKSAKCFWVQLICRMLYKIKLC